MSGTIDYGNLMHHAMRGLIQTVLQEIADSGLPGEHHFFITFDMQHPDVEIADWLSDRYPEEMTIIMQHWFDNLEVTDNGFSITLNFGDNPEAMYVPYDAILTFVDPSVEFGLRFETQDGEDEVTIDDATSSFDPTALEPKKSGKATKSDDKKKDAEIVSLDSFRK